jgi:DNA repair protein RadC
MIKTKKPSYTGHRNRIKTKYSKNGISGWLDYEVLELALSFAIPRKDTKPLAKELLTKFKSLNAVLDADVKELKEISGISDHTATFLKLMKDIVILYLEKGLEKKDLLSSPAVVYDYLRTSLKGSVDEEFKMVFLDSKNQLINVETLKAGTVNRSVVYPRKIVERALYNHAVGVIVAHNHPSGALQPSQEDRDITKAIREALKTVDIALLDHIIVGNNSYFSFKDRDIEI